MARNSEELRKQLKHLEKMDEDTMNTALGAMLYRQDCPDKMMLGDYELGLLAADEQQRIAQHLAQCPHCPAELARLKKSLVEDELLTTLEPTKDILSTTPEPSWVEQALDYGRAWLEQESGRWRQVSIALSNLGQPSETSSALSGFMNESIKATPTEQHSLTIAPSETNFNLEVTMVPDGENLCRLQANVALLDRFGDFSGIWVALQWGTDIYTKETNALGEVTFNQLPCDQLGQMNITVLLPG